MFGVSHFGAILPPGTGAILAVGGAAPSVQVRRRLAPRGLTSATGQI